jgi:hypothetical protein
MRWYLSGPMTGLPDFNRPAFHAVARQVRAAGQGELNPAELCPPGLRWAAAMAIDLRALDTADGVILLPGWERSRGARIEVQRAKARDLPIVPWAVWQRTYGARPATAEVEAER